jgi:serum/glucocorticoid-regulated kinase 2
MVLKKGHNHMVDWYNVGVILYEFLVGYPPYYSQNQEEMMRNIKYGTLVLPNFLSHEVKELLKKLL